MLIERKLRKVTGRSNALMTVYECDSCLWLTNALYEKQFSETAVKFERHDCNEKPFRKRPVPHQPNAF